ncbi:GNAT family N-acetyltransferase [Fictibacillus barbaricus]|uniref:Diamine N-acetyltransferase n=1 Tax=Fictibacillus barbaricus TaxID=182136 RepID=A0ABU1TVX2_9BACL|nr:GNAT family N-acetyltransferase [Fictibacillus barbaricus]MDR7071358.1 diamine N-acetyltransferase [Fictibacillus barbaricus]
MKINLQKVTRDNWEEAMNLQVREEQTSFVPSVAVSLAKVYIKPDGDQVEYLPFAIYDGEKMVGFIMHAYEEQTTYSYWINGFIIDASQQGKGYGRAAFQAMIDWIKSTFKQCNEIRLTVHKENGNAKKLYERTGFQKTSQMFGNEEVWRFLIKK